MVSKANHARTYNNPVSRTNEIWAAKVLGMEENKGSGPDILGEGKFAEVKFTLIHPKGNKGNYPRCWTVLEHQLEFADIWSGQGFWALELYEIDRPFRKIHTFDPEVIESFVVSRELYLVNWTWMYQFPPHRTKGKTDFTEWDQILRYPKEKDIPKIKRTYEVEKGLVHLTQGVPEYMFDVKINV